MLGSLSAMEEIVHNASAYPVSATEEKLERRFPLHLNPQRWWSVMMEYCLNVRNQSKRFKTFLIPDLLVRFPNDPCNSENAITFPEDAKKQLCHLGPCQPKPCDLDGHKYPRTEIGKNNRSFQENWYKHVLINGASIDRKWLEYSPSKDSMFFVFAVCLVQL